MSRLERHRQDWEILASEDPLWAVLTDPARRGRRWSVEDFLQTGEEEIGGVLEEAAALGLPARRGAALDFGCGAGRLTRALSLRFDRAVGVDISAEMIRVAREINADRPNCEFVVNDAADLARFESSAFDFVYSSIVLQHVPGRELALGYVRELVRVLADGGLLVFQVPQRQPALRRLQLSRRLYSLARRLGARDEWLLRRTPLTPMRMLALRERDVRSSVAAAAGTVLRVDADVGRYVVAKSSRWTASRARAEAPGSSNTIQSL
jgi:SAM-dependent methyltransferase